MKVTKVQFIELDNYEVIISLEFYGEFFLPLNIKKYKILHLDVNTVVIKSSYATLEYFLYKVGRSAKPDYLKLKLVK